MKFECRDYKNFHEIFKEAVDKLSDKEALKWFVDGERTDSLSWKEFYGLVKDASKSLMALGVEKDTKVGILSDTCHKWVIADFGIMSAGACTVGIHQTDSAKNCLYTIRHSDSVLVFAENREQLSKLLEMRDDMPGIRKVVLFEGNCDESDWAISWDDFLELGKAVSDEEFGKRSQSVSPEDTAGIVYTSGTTGVPKGAGLTHDNITFTVQSTLHCMRIADGDEMFLFLPLAHIFARIAVYTAVLGGTATFFSRGMDTLAADFKIANPAWFVAVPRIFEKIFSKVLSEVETKGGLSLRIFKWACKVGFIVSESNRTQIPLLLSVQYRIADKLVFSKVREAFGNRVRWCVSGGAPLNPEICRFFHAAGILVMEGIGMTENTSFSNVNRHENYRFGWVGRPGPGIEQKISEDGEIMIRGRNVMKGYYKMPEETAETITGDGWLRTGDVGEIDSQNFLRVTGRKKELVITAGGRNIAPVPIESFVALSKYISQVCIAGDKRKFLSALVTPDLENIAEYADAHGIEYGKPEDLIVNKEIFDLVWSEVAEKNKSLAMHETIRKITVVPLFTVENDMMTPTFKLKKDIIFEKYKEEIDAMCPIEHQGIKNDEKTC